MDIHQQLIRPFPANRLHWRIGSTNAKRNGGNPDSGIALAFVDARDVMQRLDDVLGPFGWETRLTEVAGTCACALTLIIDGRDVTRTDTADKTDVEGSKGAASVALRRAAAQFGVGRYLYKLPNVWVPMGADLKKEPGAVFAGQGRYFVPPALPTWATPEGFDAIMAKREAA